MAASRPEDGLQLSRPRALSTDAGSEAANELGGFGEVAEEVVYEDDANLTYTDQAMDYEIGRASCRERV